MQTQVGKRTMSTSYLTKIAILSAMSVILYLFEFPLPLFPDFLKIDITDLPAIMGTLIAGPVAGIFIELIKNIIHAITLGHTNGIGEFANFFVGISYIIPLGLLIRNKTKKSYILGSIAGIITMLVVACFLNYYFLMPAYAELYGVSIQSLIDVAHKINPNITTLRDYVFFAVAPFNIIKAVLISLLGYLVYKSTKGILRYIV